MPFVKTAIPDLYIFEPRVFEDSRGYFFEAYNEETFREVTDFPFVQDNQSFSKRGAIRGLHYQLPPYAQTKIVRVISGTILDVAVDIRKGSPTFGQHVTVELSDENRKQLFIPRGFAHGFSVLSETAEVLYKCDNLYNKESDAGIIYNDPALGIDWKIAPPEAIVSEKDKVLPVLRLCTNTFEYRIRNKE